MAEDVSADAAAPAERLDRLKELLSEGSLLPIVTRRDDGPWRVVAMVPSEDLLSLGLQLNDIASLNGLVIGPPVTRKVHAGSFARSQHMAGQGDGRSWSFDLNMVRGSLVDDMVPAFDQLDPVPHATVEQARRLAALKTRLLRSGAFTARALADGWEVALPTARKRLDRARDRGEVFTVIHDGEVLLPAFVLDGQMQIRGELTDAMRALTEAGEDGWAAWAWFTSPSGWLDGRVPEEVAASDAAAVAHAARRRASNAA
jgi:hypothetical protein